VWNKIVSRRIKEFGLKPIVGDLVFVDNEDYQEVVDQEGTVVASDEFPKRPRKKSKKAAALAARQAGNRCETGDSDRTDDRDADSTADDAEYKGEEEEGENEQKHIETLPENVVESGAEEKAGENTAEGNAGESTVKENAGESTVKENAGESTVKENAGESTAKESAGESTAKENAGESTIKENVGESTAEENAGESAVKENAGEGTAEENAGEGTAEESPEGSKQCPLLDYNQKPPAVRAITEEELDNVKIEDVVLPMPGHNVMYPNNVIKQWYEELLAVDGLSFTAMKQNVR